MELNLYERGSEMSLLKSCKELCVIWSFLSGTPSLSIHQYLKAMPIWSLHPTSLTCRCNSFDVVCLCVCPSICLTLPAKRTNTQTWILAKRYSGRISRSSLKVKVIGQRSRSPGQKKFYGRFNWLWEWCVDVAVIEATEESDVGCFKAYVVF